jgi:hypothetical protein
LNLLDKIRKGFRFFLMSMGVSTYDKKPHPSATAAKTVAYSDEKVSKKP